MVTYELHAMSAIPETRTMDSYRRVVIPEGIVESFGRHRHWCVTARDGGVVLEPSEDDRDQTLTDRNRLYLPPKIAENYAPDEEFAVIEEDSGIVLKPTDQIDISL